ncbi:MAG: PEP-CTERM sorting domain-containing protein [Pseudomonadota bacterium]
MSIFKLFKSVLCTTVLAAASFSASAMVVDYTFDLPGVPYGSFSGVDTNHDGILTFDELTSFDFEYPLVDTTGINLAMLDSFGSYNIGINTWNSDATGWGYPNFAWFSWENGDRALVAQYATVHTSLEAEVPEPLTLGLFAIGLLGLGVIRRRKY